MTKDYQKAGEKSPAYFFIFRKFCELFAAKISFCSFRKIFLVQNCTFRKIFSAQNCTFRKIFTFSFVLYVQKK